MMRFMVTWPGGEKAAFLAEGEDIFIGRVASINDIALQDASVSRQHAQIKKKDDAYYVYDLKSLNGVVLNGTRVSRAPLKDGDTLKFGEVTVQIQLHEATASESLLEIEASDRTKATFKERDSEEVTEENDLPLKKP